MKGKNKQINSEDREFLINHQRKKKSDNILFEVRNCNYDNWTYSKSGE